MGFASQMENSRKNNAALLKKKRYFNFHQEVIQKFFTKGNKSKRPRKKLTAKQIQKMRRQLEFDQEREESRKIFVLGVSFVITIVILSLIVFIFTEYVF